MLNKILLSFFSFWVSLVIGFSQGSSEYRNTSSAISFGFSYGIGVPSGDLSDRFGSINTLGADAEYITKGSLIFGISNRFLFGGTVKEDVLSSLRSSNGAILSTSGEYATVVLKMRGSYIGITLGKLFSFSRNKKSGLRISISPGVMEHKVRIDEKDSGVLQFVDPYLQGYDRKTVGFGISEFIGYQHMGIDRRLNIFGGIELFQGFTSNIRPIDFNTLMKDDKNRIDHIISIKAGLILPLYIGDTVEEEIFY